LVSFDLVNETYDPFAHGYDMAFGFESELTPNIGSLELNYVTRIAEENRIAKTEYPVPLMDCNETNGFPLNTKRMPI